MSLIKKVGFAEFVRITRTVKQIQRALTRAIESFPAHRKKIQAMIDSYDNQMPQSASQALARLHKMLEASKLPKEIIDAILRCVKEEMNQSSDTPVYDDGRRLTKALTVY